MSVANDIKVLRDTFNTGVTKGEYKRFIDFVI